MDRTFKLPMNSPIKLNLALTSLPVMWTVKSATMTHCHVTMSYRATLKIADVSLQCLSSLIILDTAGLLFPTIFLAVTDTVTSSSLN